jgi:hypothetical protein
MCQIAHGCRYAQARKNLGPDRSQGYCCDGAEKFWDYCIGHRKRLRELHVALEGALNEIGMRCLPYPEKGSTIGDVIV